MCGYCVEAIIMEQFIKKETFSEPIEYEEMFLPNYLQESKGFPGILDQLKSFKNLRKFVDIAFCRLWEMLLDNEEGWTYKDICTLFGEASVNEFLISFGKSSNLKNWRPLGDTRLYENSDYRNRFFNNKQPLIDKSKQTLISYYDWWIDGFNKKKETSNENTAKDLEKFYDLFPAIFFSFSVLARHQSSSDILKKIAVDNRNTMPDFPGYDLWLEKKAFLVCIKEYGIQFILDSDKKIRIESVYYALLKNAFSKDELSFLEKKVSGRMLSVTGMEIQSILELINVLKQK